MPSCSMSSSALKQVKDFVSLSFEQNHPKHLYYHSFAHSQEVVKTVSEIGKSLEPKQYILLQIAAWLHDIGYLYGYDQHEARSIKIAISEWSKWGLEQNDLEQVTLAIAATELGVAPQTEMAALLADADLFYGVGKQFFERGPLLRKEWEVCKEQYYSDMDWELLQLNFLQSVKFESDYGQQQFAPHVAENLKKQEALVEILLKD